MAGFEVPTYLPALLPSGKVWWGLNSDSGAGETQQEEGEDLVGEAGMPMKQWGAV